MRGSCDPFSNLFPFASSFFSSAGRLIPSRKNDESEKGKEKREREGEGNKREKGLARAEAEETRTTREKRTTPRCLPFIKLLLNAAFLRTHN